jgi:hypothetical protein
LIAKVSVSYYFFVSTFKSNGESLVSQGTTYKITSFESFCHSLTREKGKLLHLGVINIVGKYSKDLLEQQKDKSNHIKNKHPLNNKHNKGIKPDLIAPTPSVDKGTKSKCDNTRRHCNLCDQYCHLESIYLKKIESLKIKMNKYTINLDYYSSNSFSHGHACSPCFLFNKTHNSPFNECLICYRSFYHMALE